VSGHPFSRDERDPDASRRSRTPEPISETLFWLWDNGLIEWNGEYRNGRKVFVITEKGQSVADSTSSYGVRTPRSGT
jgi:hypothetical protein